MPEAAQLNPGNNKPFIITGKPFAPEDEAALRLRPNYLTARNNLGTALIAVGRVAEAVRHLHEALGSASEDLASPPVIA